MQQLSVVALLGTVFFVLNVLPGRASTVSHTFDVVDVRFDFAESLSPADGSPDYPAFIDAVHPLAALREQTFRMGVEIADISAQFPNIQQEYDPATEILSRITCVFGPVCVPGSTLFRTFPANLQPATGLATPDGTSFGTDSPFTGDYMVGVRIDPTNGSGIFWLQTDIADFFTLAQINGRTYYGQGPGITLSLANVDSSELTTIPLPASALLLAAGLIPLALLRRRRRS